MKVTVLLRNDHETLQGLFTRYKKANVRNNEKRELFNEIYREISIHSQMESEIFYPALAATPSARAAELLSSAEKEHRAFQELLRELNAMNGSDKNFDAKMARLMDEVGRHIAIDEEEIFDEARKNLPEFRLEELGLEMEERRKIMANIAA